MAEYNREKTLAVGTGIVCGLVCLAGTVLGSVHAITKLGALAGMLAASCYLIADVAEVWAARIDYYEDKNPVEWAAWMVKYGMMLVLLFNGGLVAFTMLHGAERNETRQQTADRAQGAYTDCIQRLGANPKRQQMKACENISTAIISVESAPVTKAKSNVDWAFEIVDYPLFPYAPGLIGVLALVGLTLVIKITKPSSEPNIAPSLTLSNTRITQAVNSAPLVAPSVRKSLQIPAPSSYNGRLVAFALQPNGASSSLYLVGAEPKARWYLGSVSQPEASLLATSQFAQIVPVALSLLNNRKDQTLETVVKAKQFLSSI